MDKDQLTKEAQERCAALNDDYSRVAFLFGVTRELLQLSLDLGADSLAQWQDKDQECAEFYARNLKVLLENQNDQLESILSLIDGRVYGEKLAAAATRLQELKSDNRLALLDEMVERSQELKDVQDKLAEYQKLEQELANADLNSLRAQTKELEGKTGEYRKELAEFQKAGTNMVEVSSALEKVNLDDKLENLLEGLEGCLAELKDRTITREKLLQIKLDEMNDYITGLKEIAAKFEKLDDLLQIGLENIRVLRFYPEYQDDEASYQELEQRIRDLDERLKKAIAEREKIALKLS